MAVTTRTGDAGTPTTAPPRQPGDGRRTGRAGDVGSNVLSHVVLIGWTVMVLVPFAWALLASVKTSREIFGSPWALPEVFQWSNFGRAWSMAAYVLARYRFPGNRVIFYLFAAGMMFPVFLAIVPLFFVVQNLGMLSTYQGLILVYVAYSLPFTVFFMHAFFRTLPTAIAEAAFIDGCSHAGVFFRVMLPMAKPGLLSIGIFNVIGQFNQFVLPSFLSPERPVLTQGIATLLASQRYEGDWGALFAALTIAMVPVVIVYLLFYRQVQAGLTSATLK